jgi:hypothetical protein
MRIESFLAVGIAAVLLPAFVKPQEPGAALVNLGRLKTTRSP